MYERTNIMSRLAGSRLVFLPFALPIIFLFGNACQHATQPNGPLLSPTFLRVEVSPNDHNRLSAIVSVKTENAIEVGVEFGVISGGEETTPFFPVAESLTQIPVLGLRENTSYVMRVVAVSGNATARSQQFTFMTRGLPEDIPKVTVLKKQSPADGFVMMGYTSPESAPASYALMVDNGGQIVWYRPFPQAVVDFQKQPNGNYTAYTSVDESPLHFYQFDNLGAINGEFQASDGFSTGPHEFQMQNGSYFLFAVENAIMDLTDIGGLANASVRGTRVELYRGGQSKLSWSPFDHLEVDDAAPDVARDSPTVNPWHGNAIDLDTDGNLLVSFRNSDEITKIDVRTGEIMWRLGGKNNEFTFVNDPLGGFSHQHGIRRLKNGNIILFDNGNLRSPPLSRALEYRLDEKERIVELVWEFQHDPPIFGSALGFAQRLPNGNTLINYGTARRVIEVDALGVVQWDIVVLDQNRFPYRALRIDSLY